MSHERKGRKALCRANQFKMKAINSNNTLHQGNQPPTLLYRVYMHVETYGVSLSLACLYRFLYGDGLYRVYLDDIDITDSPPCELSLSLKP